MYEIYETLLKSRGLKTSDIVKATGLNATFFSEWKKGKTKTPSMKNLQKIADFFGVTVEYLMTGKTNKFSSEMAAIDLELTDMPLEMKKYALKLAELSEDKQKQIMSLIDMLKN